ncbi:MAG: hypothetical protein AAF226_09965, partial [Verrucomicrobiota bacterium]
MSSDNDDFFSGGVDSSSEATANQRQPKNAKRGCLRLMFLMGLCCAAFAVLAYLLIDATNSGGKVKRFLSIGGEEKVRVVEKIVPVEKVVVQEKIVVEEKIVEVQPPLPSKHIDWNKTDVAELWNGIQVSTEVDGGLGETAALEREKAESFTIEYKVTVKKPVPSETMAQLETLNPNLAKMLPGLPTMMQSARVSGFYHKLYDLKTERIQQHITRMNRIVSRHNFYDCDTVLEMENPGSGQKVLFIQGDMDVVSDGSDGDRKDSLDDYIS